MVKKKKLDIDNLTFKVTPFDTVTRIAFTAEENCAYVSSCFVSLKTYLH